MAEATTVALSPRSKCLCSEPSAAVQSVHRWRLCRAVLEFRLVILKGCHALVLLKPFRIISNPAKRVTFLDAVLFSIFAFLCRSNRGDRIREPKRPVTSKTPAAAHRRLRRVDLEIENLNLLLLLKPSRIFENRVLSSFVLCD